MCKPQNIQKVASAIFPFDQYMSMHIVMHMTCNFILSLYHHHHHHYHQHGDAVPSRRPLTSVQCVNRRLTLDGPIVEIDCHWGQSKLLDSNILETNAFYFSVYYIDICTRVIMKIPLGF